MPSLKELRNSRKSVQATKKITSAMKMIAAAKLRRAQDQAEASRPYAKLMQQMLTNVVESLPTKDQLSPLLVGRAEVKTHLFVIATSNRGLCGGFNSNIVRQAKRLMEATRQQGTAFKILCVGRKGRDQLQRDYRPHIIDTVNAFDKPRFHDIALVGQKILHLFESGQVDAVTIIYNHFVSALTQHVTVESLIPAMMVETVAAPAEATKVPYGYEPSERQVLETLLPKNLNVQLFKAILENQASEHGARMAAMDGATRNADDMIKALDLRYNRTRQAVITKELIEIISGAEAV